MPPRKPKAPPTATAPVEDYRHPTETAPARPEAGIQAQYRPPEKAPVTYRYDSSLAPELNWDGGNAAREEGEAGPGAARGRARPQARLDRKEQAPAR